MAFLWEPRKHYFGWTRTSLQVHLLTLACFLSTCRAVFLVANIVRVQYVNNSVALLWWASSNEQEEGREWVNERQKSCYSHSSSSKLNEKLRDEIIKRGSPRRYDYRDRQGKAINYTSYHIYKELIVYIIWCFLLVRWTIDFEVN